MNCRYIFIGLLLLVGFSVFAHPMPSSVVSLSVHENNIAGEARMPFLDLEGVLKMDVDNNLDVNTSFFREYFRQHIKAYTGKELWVTTIDSICMSTDYDVNVGDYREVIVHFKMTPSHEKDLRKFVFNYDVIIHQIITHSILVYLENDWKNGVRLKDIGKPLGTIYTNFSIGTGKYEPLTVNLEEGSWWKGLISMVSFGMEHIKEGTDHLLFLLVLLLPATLLVQDKKWNGFAGTKHSLAQLLKIVTAFTFGHSITLLIGAFGLFNPDTQIIEVLIALSILVSAIHAIHPIFPGKEFYVAAGFGLIHGMAFASALQGIGLGMRTLVLSILGFNIGIEMIQLFIIILIVPWLILLSELPVYKWIRIISALLASIASIAWIAERVIGKGNWITQRLALLPEHGVWYIIGFAVFSLIIFSIYKYKGVIEME